MEPVILKGRKVRREEAPARRLATQVASGERKAPSVRTLVVDGVVRALEVTCSCGEVTTVDLVTGPTNGSVPGGGQ